MDERTAAVIQAEVTRLKEEMSNAIKAIHQLEKVDVDHEAKLDSISGQLTGQSAKLDALLEMASQNTGAKNGTKYFVTLVAAVLGIAATIITLNK